MVLTIIAIATAIHVTLQWYIDNTLVPLLLPKKWSIKFRGYWTKGGAGSIQRFLWDIIVALIISSLFSITGFYGSITFFLGTIVYEILARFFLFPKWEKDLDELLVDSRIEFDKWVKKTIKRLLKENDVKMTDKEIDEIADLAWQQNKTHWQVLQDKLNERNETVTVQSMVAKIMPDITEEVYAELHKADVEIFNEVRKKEEARKNREARNATRR